MPFEGEDRLRALASREGLDAIALVPGANFRRVYGKDFHQNERVLIVIIPVDGTPAAVVPSLEAASFEMIGFSGDVFHWRDNEGPGDAFVQIAACLPAFEAIGVEGQRMRVMEYHGLMAAMPDTDMHDRHSAISSTLRLLKEQWEIERLERAIAISEAALERTLQSVSVGQTEVEIESMLLGSLFDCGAHGLAFEPIVAAGDNSHRPHAKARPDYRIKPGDSLLFDFGATFDGYHADITRTVFVKTCDERSRAQYETVLAANATGRAAACSGMTCHDLDDRVLRVLESSPFADHVRTKTGHGLGLDVHEDPYIMRGNHQTLEPGMVFTIEPGLYVPGVAGVRIEDDVVVTLGGVRSLTGFPRELRLVG